MFADLLSWYEFEYEWFLRAEHHVKDLERDGDPKGIKKIWFVEMMKHKEAVHRLREIFNKHYPTCMNVIDKVDEETEKTFKEAYGLE